MRIGSDHLSCADESSSANIDAALVFSGFKAKDCLYDRAAFSIEAVKLLQICNAFL